jgi:hypothetical protein
MSDYPVPEKLSDQDLGPILDKLRLQIDINSRALLDMISDEAVVVDLPLPLAHVKTTAACSEVTIDEAFDDW